MRAEDLAALLDASLALWGVDGRAEPGPGLCATVESSSLVVRVRRRDGGLEDPRPGAGWALEAPGEPEETVGSLNGVLRRLRRRLQPNHVPGRALVGVRPPEPGVGA